MDKKESSMRIAVDTLGCKLNQAESEALTEQFIKSGCRIVSPDSEFDVYVLNTCTVTHIADRKARHLLRMAHRRNPEAVLIVTGCYAEHAPHEIAEIDGVKLVVSNSDKLRLPQILQESGLIPAASDGAPLHSLTDKFRTRSFIRIQDGCNNFCSYCIVPYVRGREKSSPPEQIVKEINDKVSRGYKEVVLTGTEIGSYSYEGLDLKGLIDIILRDTDVTRLRLSSLQPQEATPDLISLWHNERLCPHFHLSLQSGSSPVLKRMNRRYTADDYLAAVSLIRSVAGDAAITTDIIVGFPGETDEEFVESYDFCKKVGFARIHVFSYSKRKGTAAYAMPNQISPQIKKKRSDMMLTLAGESASEFHLKFLGGVLAVLWEQCEGGIWSGYTGNYIRVYTESGEDLTNMITNASLEFLYGDGVWGKIID